MNNKEILIFKNSDQIVETAIKKWSGIADNAIKQRGFFTVALSGGSTPVKLYKELSGTDLKWDKTHIFIVDERFVPFDHSDSNYRMINETLLSNINIPEQNIHPVPTGKGSSDESARSYEGDLLSFFNLSYGGIPIFDLVLLGLGDDGHTASLFPGASALTEKDHLAVSATPLDKSMHERITITFPVINNARNIYFMVTGSSKASVVLDVLGNQDSKLPAALVKPEKGDLCFLLDKSAGALLSEGKV
jgi:6-phosphogluconolactonase